MGEIGVEQPRTRRIVDIEDPEIGIESHFPGNHGVDNAGFVQGCRDSEPEPASARFVESRTWRRAEEADAAVAENHPHDHGPGLLGAAPSYPPRQPLTEASPEMGRHPDRRLDRHSPRASSMLAKADDKGSRQ